MRARTCSTSLPSPPHRAGLPQHIQSASSTSSCSRHGACRLQPDGDPATAESRVPGVTMDALAQGVLDDGRKVPGPLPRDARRRSEEYPSIVGPDSYAAGVRGRARLSRRSPPRTTTDSSLCPRSPSMSAACAVARRAVTFMLFRLRPGASFPRPPGFSLPRHLVAGIPRVRRRSWHFPAGAPLSDPGGCLAHCRPEAPFARPKCATHPASRLKLPFVHAPRCLALAALDSHIRLEGATAVAYPSARVLSPPVVRTRSARSGALRSGGPLS